MISNLNELSQKFGYTMKTFNILGIVLMIQGEIDKAVQIYENALQEHEIYQLMEAAPDDPKLQMLSPTNNDLATLIFNYIKCNAIKNGHLSIVIEGYKENGLQSFLRTDELSIKLFTILSKMQSPLAKEFFEERQQAEAMFDSAVKQI